jgi:hypothetical protein
VSTREHSDDEAKGTGNAFAPSSTGVMVAACIMNGDPLDTVRALPTHELLARYRKGIENYDKRIFWMTPDHLDHAFLPEAGVGTWPVRVLLGHLADAEMVLSHRMRRAVAEDHPVLAVWDENAFIDANIYGTADPAAAPTLDEKGEPASNHMSAVGGFLAVVHTLRMWTADWLASLTPDQWERRALHPQAGPQSVRDIAGYSTWHLEHHSRFLKAKLDRLFGAGKTPVSAGLEGAPAGACGAGCGCAQPQKPA